MTDDLLPSTANDPHWTTSWEQLGQGVPTLAGLAQVASRAVASGGDKTIRLSMEARCLLFAAKDRGILEIKGSNRAFESPARMLAVHVETGPDRTLIFRSRDKPMMTIRFLAGFRELCASGLVMHHIFTEFSLSREGLELANSIPEAEIGSLLATAREICGME
ncbi:MAG TPA: hypothetical protein VFV87_10555 [Pirellulaceae bacterium]|nr:hypothetical protein [Pirellulaceae bacterium]